ncbi:helix-turn-helix transcriptional regulator [Limnothrix sp. FACHB-1083]|uniref:helix-turn-helix transcriptional regulator n=1 Tax=unclassified Limnothrix TaxID=2632864 RepID=UPI001681A97F|nr:MULTISPECIES: helix-turn-helix transcriptional regulator [unclassified Limnothrix]MBD2161430.1 helix-turn-helix transcriptional regulator [Limnothrix sp. FACHB-1083]MBD2192059.1 helix-turn-helix transcriptional regulator [Limnothrix sp. FACHB-1088]
MPQSTKNPVPCERLQAILKERGLTQIDLCYTVFVSCGVKLTPQHLNAAIKGREYPSLRLQRAVSTALNLPLGEAFPEYHTVAETLIRWYQDLRQLGRIDYAPLASLSGLDYARLVSILRKQDAPTHWERQALARVAGMGVSELFPEF